MSPLSTSSKRWRLAHKDPDVEHSNGEDDTTVSELDQHEGSDTDRSTFESNDMEQKPRCSFAAMNLDILHASYNIEPKKIGKGAHGFVWQGTHTPTREARAIKLVTSSTSNTRSVDDFHEIEMLKMVDHPNIIRLYEKFVTDTNLFLVMELCTGGDLFDHLDEIGHVSEQNTAIIMHQVMTAVSYMHVKCICHRDLKPENFMLQTRAPIHQNILKLIDFGSACTFEPGQLLIHAKGTPLYMAPEMIVGRYTHMCDLWSCGVMMYVCLSGFLPFPGPKQKQIFRNVLQGHFDFKDVVWEGISDNAKDLILCLLEKDTNKRFSAKNALHHPWLRPYSQKKASVSLTLDFLHRFHNFKQHNKLKKAALQIIASHLDDIRLWKLRRAFIAMDVGGDGVLSMSELRSCLGQPADSPSDLEQIMEEFELDDKVVNYTEFLAATLETGYYARKDVCWMAFSVIDMDGDGMLSKEDLQQFFSNGKMDQLKAAQEAAELLHDLAPYGESSINFEVFRAMMRGTAVHPFYRLKSTIWRHIDALEKWCSSAIPQLYKQQATFKPGTTTCCFPQLFLRY